MPDHRPKMVKAKMVACAYCKGTGLALHITDRSIFGVAIGDCPKCNGYGEVLFVPHRRSVFDGDTPDLPSATDVPGKDWDHA